MTSKKSFVKYQEVGFHIKIASYQFHFLQIDVGQLLPNSAVVFDKAEGSLLNMIGKSKGYGFLKNKNFSNNLFPV